MLSDDETAKIQAAFGRRVRRFRSELGVSQERLGEISGLHRTYISSVERGERNVALVNIHVLAVALEVTPSALVQDALDTTN